MSLFEMRQNKSHSYNKKIFQQGMLQKEVSYNVFTVSTFFNSVGLNPHSEDVHDHCFSIAKQHLSNVQDLLSNT